VKQKNNHTGQPNGLLQGVWVGTDIVKASLKECRRKGDGRTGMKKGKGGGKLLNMTERRIHNEKDIPFHGEDNS